MLANYISLDLIDKLREKKIIEGKISSVLPTLFTVITDDGDLIYFLNNKKYIAPMSIVLEDLGSFKDFNLSRDTKVKFENKYIMIDSHRIEIELDCAQSWNPEMELLLKETSEDIIDKNLSLIEEGVYKHGKYEGFAPLIYNIGDYIEELKSFTDLKIHNNLYSSFISERIIEFVFDVVNNDIDHISKDVCQFIGFGPGITPSSDDFLCGFMIALIYLGKYYDLDLSKVCKFNEDLISQIDLDKKLMSHNLLFHYSKGDSQKMIKNLINSLIYEPTREETCKHIREAISFGDISGTDMVCGVYIGTRIIRLDSFKKNFI